MAFEKWLLSRARVSAKRHRRITLDDKMSFFQQFGALVSSGAPLLQAIELSAQQTASDGLREALDDVAGRVAAGCQLHLALADHDRVFEPHWIALIGTGEVSGNMQQVLNDLNRQIRDAQEAKRKISGALTYPAILLLVAALVVVVMLWFVVPTFAEMFDEMNAELPEITQTVLAASDLVADYGLYGLGGIIVCVFLARQYLRTEPGLRNARAVIIALPVIGDLAVQVAMYRFASNFALLLKSGIPMFESLGVLSDVFRRDPAYYDAMGHARARLAAGCPLADALEESGLFTSMLVNAVRIGEQSARLGPVLEEMAPYYKEKVNSFLARATKLLEPCIIVGMGAMIATLMLAIYMPMFEMAGKVN